MSSTLPGELNVIYEIVEMITAELKQGTIDLFGKEQGGRQIGMILTVDQEFLSDPSLADLVDGQFVVLGKVTRVLRQKDDSVNLLRNTVLGGLSPDILNKLKDGLYSMREAGLEYPEIVTHIQAPALQIVPLAIFA